MIETGQVLAGREIRDLREGFTAIGTLIAGILQQVVLWIPDGIGKLACVVGIIVSCMVMYKLKLEIKKLKMEIGKKS